VRPALNVRAENSGGHFSAAHAAPMAFKVAPAVISDKKSGSAVPTKESDCPMNAKSGVPILNFILTNISGEEAGAFGVFTLDAVKSDNRPFWSFRFAACLLELFL
jgi:hypothetical protein